MSKDILQRQGAIWRTSVMAGEWREVALEEVADDITVGHVGSMASEYVESGIPLLAR